MKSVRSSWGRAFAAASLGMLGLVPAHSSPLPSVIDFTVNGQAVVSTNFTLSSSGNASFSGTLTTADYIIDYSIEANTSPLLTYEFTIDDLTGAPLTFADHFSTLVPAGPWDSASASLSVSGSPGSGGDFALTTGSGSFSDVQATGATTFDLGVALGGNCPALTSPASCYALQTAALFPRQTLSSLDVFTDFTLSGRGASITVDGSASLSAPEPGGWALVLGGACLVALGARRRRR